MQLVIKKKREKKRGVYDFFLQQNPIRVSSTTETSESRMFLDLFFWGGEGAYKVFKVILCEYTTIRV